MENMMISKLNTGKKSVVGIDIGSTTAKIVLVQDGIITFELYERHFSHVREKAAELLRRAEKYIGDVPVYVACSGSAGLGVARAAGIPFVQEVYATAGTVRELEPDTSVVIELGGEDAKAIFFQGAIDERMNGSCAGGTGAFIDQMATLMDVTPQELDELSMGHERIYPIASRCGVFAKTDIQPLLNQGARKEDVAASIYQAVVDQTIAGLVQGRSIHGKVMFLGGPLYYSRGLRERFVDTLKLQTKDAVFPGYGLYAVAIGAALYASKQDKPYTFGALMAGLETAAATSQRKGCIAPLFRSESEYMDFKRRHSMSTVAAVPPEKYRGRAYLGVDCGSTTTKLALVSEDGRMIHSYYGSNRGTPVDIVKSQLERVYELCGDDIQIAGSAVTGYGEELIKRAFHIDEGVVETMAHYTAARHFSPDVDFILDIGGQDIKCFKVRNNSIDSIMLNEACSSGCGSFIETFARSMGYEIGEFSRLGLMARAPVDLGSRCTVFMNSSVKQAQKDGAGVGDISAGLSRSVVKNAIYKVIRVNSADELGENIVVQGGTFLSDAVLRCFELELGRNVVRPEIAGLMGAYGAALHARSLGLGKTALLDRDKLRNFTHAAKAAVCAGCTNRCKLTVNIFNGSERYISGNQCAKGAGETANEGDLGPMPNLYQFKRDKLGSLKPGDGERGVIGIPLALGMYELAPLWHGIFEELGFSVVFSGMSSREIYSKGQFSIPSDTACYPAKLMHGHIETLIERGVDAIFYPCLTYNVNERTGTNHYNCPVVAYYPELLNANMESLKNVRFLFPYLNINNRRELSKELRLLFRDQLGINITRQQAARAVSAGFYAYKAWMDDICAEGERAVRFAQSHKKRIMILAGRPYHADPEICHGIDRLAASLGFVVVSEDSVRRLAKPARVDVLNQWTYHSRLYRAARFAAGRSDCELVQLVSFGCGIDAVTTDEVRSILEGSGKLYTQIKIDEITNLGAVKIRLRSLIGALEERESANEKQERTHYIYKGHEEGAHDPRADDASVSF